MDTSATHAISGIEIMNWFHSGARAVEQQKKYLNAINVFPVADGDTGTNMVVTLQAMVDHSPNVSSFSAMIRRIAEAGMAYARGNSGIIFASYVNGIAVNGASHESVTISQLSGTHNAILKELKQLDSEGKRVTFIDSRLNSGAQGLLVKHAAELLDRGLGHGETVREIEARIPRTKFYVCLETIEYAVLGGRISNTVGRVGVKIGLRPIMTLNPQGGCATFGLALSQKGITRKILRLVENTVKNRGVEAYSIVHGGNQHLAEEYRDKLIQVIGKPSEFIAEISAVVAIHSGPECVAVICAFHGLFGTLKRLLKQKKAWRHFHAF